MPTSVLDAIKLGIWDFEPEPQEDSTYRPTHALPGTHEKVSVLARRVQQGLPLWHPGDSTSYEEQIERAIDE